MRVCVYVYACVNVYVCVCVFPVGIDEEAYSEVIYLVPNGACFVHFTTDKTTQYTK